MPTRRPSVASAKSSADVVTVAELTPEVVSRLTDAGIAEAFPTRCSSPPPVLAASACGVATRSPRCRRRGTAVSRCPPRGWRYRSAPRTIAGQCTHHVPVSDRQNIIEDWRNGMAGAKAQLDNSAAAAGPGAVIVRGHYNSTPDMRQFRDLLTNGYHDAVEQTGSDFAPTFPADT